MRSTGCAHNKSKLNGDACAVLVCGASMELPSSLVAVPSNPYTVYELLCMLQNCHLGLADPKRPKQDELSNTTAGSLHHKVGEDPDPDSAGDKSAIRPLSPEPCSHPKTASSIDQTVA